MAGSGGPGHGGPATRPDVLSVGETMVLLAPPSGAPLVDRPALDIEIGGAESNVACGVAQLGHRAAWLSRVGDDPFGRIITAELARRGVDTGAVTVDPDRPTGLYLKDPGRERTRVHYYRAGSAASAMAPDLAHGIRAAGARITHLSGITPVLSADCAALVESLLTERAPDAGPISFDVNHRPALWAAGPAGTALLPLARAADIVFIGRDEAEALWGTATDDAVRALLPDVGCLVVKDADIGATCYEGEQRTFVPALAVDVVEPVGAGDAFAAGFLSGLLDGRPARDRLRLGHIAAAATLQSVSDLAVLPPSAERERLIAAADADWPGLALPGPAA
ncbi:2-dehydro-3-deoxygluconokinase [Murinocardiopsis flavida]|uniref:2-dehydro-3-deoxygluconokinase n=1 Tax=Murinocardiopsis flavida TaxID=645275 RepID=A0A2P8DQQ2_9ACTN|nr:sugar kinase [Murinocardiopsis flavida]PSK99530.1 2-dehydro-3-deoxygluconokinase [Murinocardiopsis flavida]